MGSTGSGNFSDYPGGKRGKEDGSGQGQPPSPPDRCGLAFQADLQDVEHCEYFARTGAVPPVGTPVTLAVRKRLVALDPTGMTVGNLPTNLNFLADCLQAGFAYDGRVSASSAGPVAFVSIDMAPVP